MLNNMKLGVIRVDYVLVAKRVGFFLGSLDDIHDESTELGEL